LQHTAHDINAFVRVVKHPLRFRLFLLTRLPSAYFSGVRVKSISENQCDVSIPYRWFSRNPFRSTYFACLAMAAEMSTGALAMAWLYNRKPAVSMLVTQMEAGFVKKATGKTLFTCRAGKEIADCIQKAIDTGEAQTIRVQSIGCDKDGNEIASFWITWSFKRRS
jgi:hypothetical protein